MIAIAVYMHTITDLLRVLLFTRTPVEGVGDESGGRGGCSAATGQLSTVPSYKTGVGHDTGWHASCS